MYLNCNKYRLNINSDLVPRNVNKCPTHASSRPICRTTRSMRRFVSKEINQSCGFRICNMKNGAVNHVKCI